LRGFATPSGATLRENMESVESVCLEAGRALRLKFIENYIENCIDAGFFRTVRKLITPRLRGFATPSGATLRENME